MSIGVQTILEQTLLIREHADKDQLSAEISSDLYCCIQFDGRPLENCMIRK